MEINMEDYEVIADILHNQENKLALPYIEYKIKHNNKIYICNIEFDYNLKNRKVIYIDESLNKFLVAKALFAYDIDTYTALDDYLIDKEMDEIWNTYNVGCGHRCIYKTDDDYYEAFEKEEKRVKEIKKYVKK